MRKPLFHFAWKVRDRQRAVLCAPTGIAVGVAVQKAFACGVEVAIMIGYISGLSSYLLLLGVVIYRADGPMTQQRVSKDDPSPKYLLIVLIIVALLGNVAVGIILTSVGNRSELHAQALLVLGVISVVLSWFLMHTAFGQHYARLFYDDIDETGQPFPGGMRGGLSFPGTDQPDYLDFVYVAFTVGLTYAMSDVSATSFKIRKLVLFHSVVSFFFYSTVLGVVLNAIVTS